MKKTEVNWKYRGVLNSDFQGKHLHKAGSEIALACEVISKDLGRLIVTVPDPVTLFLNKAEDLIQSTSENKINILKKLKYDASPSKEIHKYLQSSMGASIFLIAAIESFLNISIPEDHIYEHNKKGSMNKGDIQRHLSMKEKIDLVLNITKSKAKEDTPTWSNVQKLLTLRDEVVHFKDSKLEKQGLILAELFDAKFEDYLNSIKDFIKSINPKYL